MGKFKSSCSLVELDSEIQKRVTREYRELEDSAQKASLDITHPGEKVFQGNDINLSLITKARDKIVLAVLLWYLDEITGWKIRLWLDDHWGHTFSEFWATAQISKEYALASLLVQEHISDRYFFGNLKRVLRTLLFCLEKSKQKRYRKPRRLVRRKGYRDKGYLRDPSRTPIYLGTLLTTEELELRREEEFFRQVEFQEEVEKYLQSQERIH